MMVFVTGFLCALVLTGMLIPVLRRAQFLDVPNHRSSHAVPTPRGGGLAVLAAVLIASAVEASRGQGVPLVPLGAAGVLAGVGLLDDLRSLSGLVRLALQGLCALAVVIWIFVNYSFPGTTTSAFVVVATATVVLVGYVNAFNFMDGVNGISSLNAVVAGVWWGVLGEHFELAELQTVGSAIAGAALGFLPWNAPRAKVFLGDVGSYGLGLIIATLSVWGWAAGVPALMAAAPLLVYLVDTGWVLVKRAIGRRPLMDAHREHVYQRLVDYRAWSHLSAAMFTAVLSALVCLAAWELRDTGSLAILAVAGVAFSYLLVPRGGPRSEVRDA